MKAAAANVAAQAAVFSIDTFVDRMLTKIAARVVLQMHEERNNNEQS